MVQGARRQSRDHAARHRGMRQWQVGSRETLSAVVSNTVTLGLAAALVSYFRGTWIERDSTLA